MEEISLFNKFFSRFSINALVAIAKIQPDKFVQRCEDGELLAIFLRLVFFSELPAAHFRPAI